ncbi:MAG: hypothetical protein WC812_01110 [Candidatus Pacearchaeota archaeon]|jgi:hypothetical protein
MKLIKAIKDENVIARCPNSYTEQEFPWSEKKQGFCKYTKKYCVGLKSPDNGYLTNDKTPITFSQDAMERCPVYKLDFKIKFKGLLSEIVRKVK